MKEIWKDIVGFEGFYQISNFGRVRSLDRYVNSKNDSQKFLKGVILKPLIQHGYCRVNLKYNGKAKTFKIHRLIAIVFLENPNNYNQINHIDGNKLNNHINNLEWCSAKQNTKHAEDNGLRNSKGETNGNAVLTEKQVVKIRYLKETTNISFAELARQFNIGETTASDICKRLTWRHI